MSKRPNPPGGPKRVPSTPVPPTARKEAIPLQPGPAGTTASTSTSSTKPKFYNGPTVSKNSGIPDYSRDAKDVAKKTVQTAKVQTRKAVAVARRHPLSIASLITTIPFFLFISLFSTVICPPPSGQSQSVISKYVFAPLGLSHPPQSGSLHQTLCYPANAYHDAVLEPYLYPLVDKAQSNVVNHPIYVKGLEPGYNRVRDTSTKIWNGPVGPVVRRAQREIKRAYLKFVQPHIPFVKTKIHTLTAPYTSRIAALHNQYLHPQIAAAQLYANSAKDQSVNSYKYIASHPVTGQAGKYANVGYQVGRKRSIDAYKWSRPHVIRGAKEGERIARDILGPRVIKALEVAGNHAAAGYKVVKSRIVALYYAHLDPHVGPYVKRTSTILAPHIETINQKIYKPYIRPSLESILPSFIFTPQPPRTFWAMISDFLPSTGSQVERKGSMDRGYSKVVSDVKTKTVSVNSKASSASMSASPSPSVVKVNGNGNAKKEKMTRAEMDKSRDNLKSKIEEQGKKGYKQVKSELVTLHKDILGTKFPLLQQGSRAEIEQDINYVVTGLDKLYSKSTVLKKDQVTKSSQQADAKLQSKVTKIKSKLDSLKKDWFEQGRPIVQRAFRPLDDLLAEKEVLAEEMAWVEDVTPKDWTKFNTLQTSVDGWKEKYMGLHNGQIKDKALLDPSANIEKNLADLYTEIDDVVEGFRARVGILKRTALDRVEAREVLSADKSSSSSSSASAASGSVSILPIVEGGAAGLGPGGYISKGKQQIEDALNQATRVLAGSSSSVSASASAASGSVSILPVIEEAAAGLGAGAIIGKGKQQIEDALHQASQVLAGSSTATPTASILPIAERVGAVGGDIIGKGKQQIEDALSQASQSIAGTPSVSGHVPQAKSAAEDLVQSASSIYHDATRSAISAVGATPSPEGIAEHAQSVVNAASSSIASIIPDTGAEAYLEQIAAQVQAGAAAAYAQAQDGVHQASRSIVSAAGGTPSPEGAAEYAASVAAQAQVSASSIGAVVSDAVHQATRSIIAAGGGTNVPENMADYASAASASASSIIAGATQAIGSVVGDVPASASSIGSVISQAVHDETRSVSSALGASPTPESIPEHISSLSNVAASQASSLSAHFASLLGPNPTPAAVSEYLASLTTSGKGYADDLLSRGSSLIASLSGEYHTATRSLAKKVGATAQPEGLGEKLEDVLRRVGEVEEGLEERLRKAVGRDEL